MHQPWLVSRRQPQGPVGYGHVVRQVVLPSVEPCEPLVAVHDALSSALPSNSSCHTRVYASAAPPTGSCGSAPAVGRVDPAAERKGAVLSCCATRAAWAAPVRSHPAAAAAAPRSIVCVCQGMRSATTAAHAMNRLKLQLLQNYTAVLLKGGRLAGAPSLRSTRPRRRSTSSPAWRWQQRRAVRCGWAAIWATLAPSRAFS